MRTNNIPKFIEYEIKTTRGIPNYPYMQYRFYSEINLNGVFINKYPQTLMRGSDYDEAINDIVKNTTNCLHPHCDNRNSKTIMIVFKDSIEPSENKYWSIWRAQGIDSLNVQ